MRISSLKPITLCTIVLLAFFLNSYALEVMGVYYVSVGGSPLFKIHLYSYVILIFVIFYVLRYGVRFYLEPLGSIKGVWLFLILSIAYVIIYGLAKYGTSGMAYVVDTLLTPVLIFPIAMSLDRRQRDYVLWFFLAILFLNSSVAILEYIKEVRIFDYMFEEYQFYFRSTAFFSHPLNNALISSFVAIFIYSFNKSNPILVFVLTTIAIFSFGARAASVIFLLLSFLSIYHIYFRKNHGVLRRDLIILKVMVMVGVSFVFYAVFFLNFGARIFENVKIDGSAQSRFDVFYIFNFLSFEELLFGASAEIFDNLTDYIDNHIVENFVIVWLLFYGVIGAFPLIIAFYSFFAKLFSNATTLSRVAVLSFLLISITNNSLASKNSALLYFLICYAATCERRLNDKVASL